MMEGTGMHDPCSSVSIGVLLLSLYTFVNKTSFVEDKLEIVTLLWNGTTYGPTSTR